MRRQWVIGCGWIIVLGGVLAMAGTQPASGPASRAVKLTVGPDTTFVTGPLNPDGTVNYVAAWNEINGKGVTPENNATVLILRAVGPKAIVDEKFRAPLLKAMGLSDLPEKGEYVDSIPVPRDGDSIKLTNYGLRSLTQPAKEADAPEIAEWLKKNEKPLASIVAASRRSKFFVPWVSAENPPTMYDGLMRFSLGSVRQATRMLATRALIKADRGDIDDAKEDLMAIHRLARLQCQGATLIDYLVAVALETLASRAEDGITMHVKLTAQQARSLLAQTQGLSRMPLPAEAFNWGERLFSLDAAMLIARNGYGGFLSRIEGDWNRILPATAASQETVLLPTFDLDVNEFLRITNKDLDQVVRCMRMQGFAACRTAFADMEKVVPSEVKEVEEQVPGAPFGLFDSLVARKRVKLLVEKLGTEDTKNLTRALARLDLSGSPGFSVFGRVFEMGVQARAEHALSIASLGLAAYHAEKGEYPDALDKLSPKYLHAVPLDPFTDKPMQYKRTDKGYLLYSVGPNMKDDGGVRDYAASAPAESKDDVCVRNEK